MLDEHLGLGKEKPRSLADIGRELEVTRERARQLVGRAMDALTSELARWIESRELR
ncbi:MAG: sigma factor-like helix-turn-helix DNA-binding protein [Thermaerobacter sp.]|nr:sigma factor-like helix-turn-helix DNA-binding protein [Thermaerobacter sp.]